MPTRVPLIIAALLRRSPPRRSPNRSPTARRTAPTSSPPSPDRPKRRNASRFVADPRLIAGGLEHPWAVAVLPDGAGFLVTERPGRLRHITRDGVVSAPIGGRAGGLRRLAGRASRYRARPRFPDSRVIYLSFAKPMGLMRAPPPPSSARPCPRITPASPTSPRSSSNRPLPRADPFRQPRGPRPRWHGLDHHRRTRRHAGAARRAQDPRPPTARSCA
jgi:hypothetical protein